MTREEALMLEFQRGSREAFEELFARYQEPEHKGGSAESYKRSNRFMASVAERTWLSPPQKADDRAQCHACPDDNEFR
jgi:hypothetical protein